MGLGMLKYAYTIGSRLCLKYDVRCMMNGADTRKTKTLQYMASMMESCTRTLGELGAVQEYKTGLIPKNEERRLEYGIFCQLLRYI